MECLERRDALSTATAAIHLAALPPAPANPLAPAMVQTQANIHTTAQVINPNILFKANLAGSSTVAGESGDDGPENKFGPSQPGEGLYDIGNIQLPVGWKTVDRGGKQIPVPVLGKPTYAASPSGDMSGDDIGSTSGDGSDGGVCWGYGDGSPPTNGPGGNPQPGPK
jgi:hypothetical protein